MTVFAKRALLHLGSRCLSSVLGLFKNSHFRKMMMLGLGWWGIEKKSQASPCSVSNKGKGGLTLEHGKRRTGRVSKSGGTADSQLCHRSVLVQVRRRRPLKGLLDHDLSLEPIGDVGAG